MVLLHAKFGIQAQQDTTEELNISSPQRDSRFNGNSHTHHTSIISNLLYSLIPTTLLCLNNNSVCISRCCADTVRSARFVPMHCQFQTVNISCQMPTNFFSKHKNRFCTCLIPLLFKDHYPQ